MLFSAAAPAQIRIRVTLVVLGFLLVSGCGSKIAGTPDSSGQGVGGPLAQRLVGEVSDAGALVHLQALQKIADENGGNRAVLSPGHEASVNYVVGVLRGAGYDVSTPTYEPSRDEGGGDNRVTPRNVIAQTRAGDPGRVVMIGAHLDSVPKGPGIVDDGSGVATLLEIATHLGASPPARAFQDHDVTLRILNGRSMARVTQRVASVMSRRPSRCRAPMARLRNTAMNLHRLAGASNIAEACRTSALTNAAALTLLENPQNPSSRAC